MQNYTNLQKLNDFSHRNNDSTQYELSARITELSNQLSSGLISKNQLSTDPEVNTTLQLALLAMEEAEKRIKRQETRIKQLESLSVTDELTQLLNRRGFLQQFQFSLSISRRNKTGGSLMILDLDKFKQINDTYGHVAGDEVLENVGIAISTVVRDSDIVGRIGGDEFSILMPGASPVAVTKRISQIRSAIRKVKFSWNHKNLIISGSIGRCDYLGYENEQEILNFADTNMYEQKAS
ncbi:MAG: GGDEF domain-containing protein [Rhodospirillaceae bacterium]|nr:GGDEF domain-containing protein [Rhodospirillaceae bacterium]|tara:strand:+ start:3959 stop:4669 length:711 start_codon:yes stop_codon:yes gene_type:complete